MSNPYNNLHPTTPKRVKLPSDIEEAMKEWRQRWLRELSSEDPTTENVEVLGEIVDDHQKPAEDGAGEETLRTESEETAEAEKEENGAAENGSSEAETPKENGEKNGVSTEDDLKRKSESDEVPEVEVNPEKKAKLDEDGSAAEATGNGVEVEAN